DWSNTAVEGFAFSQRLTSFSEFLTSSAVQKETNTLLYAFICRIAAGLHNGHSRAREPTTRLISCSALPSSAQILTSTILLPFLTAAPTRGSPCHADGEKTFAGCHVCSLDNASRDDTVDQNAEGKASQPPHS